MDIIKNFVGASVANTEPVNNSEPVSNTDAVIDDLCEKLDNRKKLMGQPEPVDPTNRTDWVNDRP
jgi:hypothetical protein